MADMQADLDNLDRLMADLGLALADQDWEKLTRLNGEVKPAIEPLMAALSAGELDAEPLRLRLTELQQFIDAANDGAARARREAQDALKGVNQNRSAAKAYQNVSSNPPK
ncbi:SOS cell division inhibitor [Marinobacter salinus]|uniref:SOS cell division inhibitor n=1 Tax=Marinobacter salinus TaxID=1874317 RepID=A0A1D9GHW0_9GAMM|nr:SOS cell division inhibitor [Marinobacter salinus]AOY87193.1 SOS cell division inhibitor [Marinobacter salinus]